MLEKKRAVVRQAVARVDGEHEPEEILRRLGGRELFALYGAMLGAVEAGITVLVDGFIVTTVASVLLRQHPDSRPYLLFSHRGSEHGHGALLEAIEAEPLLSLDLRLGEASGALTAFSLVDSAALLHANMATFDEAQVPDREG
jgi:nicotinate-nucleotide--dimethylbenzimidazole phosphoribosyltransferase